MNEIGTLSLVLLALVVVVLGVLYIVVAKLKGSDTNTKNSSKKTNNNITLNHLLKIVTDRSSSRQELENALFTFVGNFSFPQKIDGKAPENAKPFLDFVDLLASHKNADAKLIVLASKEVKRKNPDYSKEIDIYEDRGVTHRR